MCYNAFMNKIDPNSHNYIIGQNIARIRKENGLTHADMEQYGISRAYYGKIELGLHSLTVDKIVLIAKVFGVFPSDLFKDADGNDIL